MLMNVRMDFSTVVMQMPHVPMDLATILAAAMMDSQEVASNAQVTFAYVFRLSIAMFASLQMLMSAIVTSTIVTTMPHA